MEIDSSVVVHFIFRWLHFIFGVLWIGHLYFFNFVNGNFQAKLDAAVKQKVVPELMPRALFFFRWGAMITFLTGYAMIIYRYWIVSDGGMKALMSSSYGQWISLGGLLGTIMWFNVWFIIWPNQKKIIKAVGAGEKPDAAKVELARKASKLNTFLSMPMLFAMGAASHLPISNWMWWVGSIIAGFLIAQTLFKLAPKVSTNVD
ncbi:MAG: urate hydroxylase PuuD [Deltaproteobacteria bacterium]|nr:urate hydroxylase PuuD [Deltaproteobacteria bacterium]